MLGSRVLLLAVLIVFGTIWCKEVLERLRADVAELRGHSDWADRAPTIIIWVLKRDSPVISSIAKQALLLNVIVFLTCIVLAVLLLTIVLIPLVILAWIALGLVAIILPIVGAVKASDGAYYTYPVVGIRPVR